MCSFKSCFLAACLALPVSPPAAGQEQIIDASFARPSPADTGLAHALRTLVRLRPISEQYATGGLYLITLEGDGDSLFDAENRRAIEHPMIDESWRYCSVFSTKNGDTVIMGRNWDNQNVGSVIVSLYQPRDGYSSVAFSRGIDMGFPLNVDVMSMASGPPGGRLLLAPFYSYDGLNEKGLCAAVTGISQVGVAPQEGKEEVFVGYLLRKLLDHAASVDEAIELSSHYVPFDLDEHSLNCHLYIADASGRSVVLEYRDNGWKKIFSDEPWQVMTNKVMYGAEDGKLREACPRYRSLSESLGKAGGKVDWRAGMQMLRDVSQKGTTWSVVYSPTSKDVYFSVYQSWEKVYHLRGFSPE